MNQIIPRHCRNWIPIGIQWNRVKEWNLKKDEEEKKKEEAKKLREEEAKLEEVFGQIEQEGLNERTNNLNTYEQWSTESTYYSGKSW